MGEPSGQGSLLPTLTEILHVFATMKVNQFIENSPYILDKSTASSSQHSTGSKRNKRLTLLNGIASLLVTEGKHDVAAVTISTRQRHNEKPKSTFYIVKNRRFTPEERQYATSLVALLQNPTTHSQLTFELTLLVAKSCRQKMLSRAVKIEQANRNRREVAAQMTFSPNESEVAQFREWCDPPAAQAKTYPEALDLFITTQLAPQAFAPSTHIRETVRALWGCWKFSQSEQLTNSLLLPKLIRRVRKLADYYRTIRQIVAYTMEEKDKRTLKLQILDPPARMLLPTLPSPMTIINRFTQAMVPSLDPFSLEDLKAVASGIPESAITMERGPAEGFIHCECALAVRLLDSIAGGVMEIGVSKRCCWPCIEFLAGLSNRPKKILVSGSHGKTYQSWLCPPGPSDAYGQLEGRARAAFELWLESIDMRRRSDSRADSVERDEALPRHDFDSLLDEFEAGSTD